MSPTATYSVFNLLLKKNLALHRQLRFGTGKKIVFLHGLGGSGRYWSEPAKILAQHNFEVISYDLLGFGESPHPEPFGYYAWQQADALRQAMWNDHLWGKVDIVGHSLGAIVALEFAKRYPKKVNRLVLCNIPIIFSSDQTKQIGDGSSDFSRMVKNELQRRGIKKLRQSKFAHKNIMPRYAKRQMQELAFTDYDLANLSEYAYGQSLEHAIENQTAIEDLSSVENPTYIIRANKDRLVIKNNVELFAKRINNCEIIDVEGTHQYPVMQPSSFSKMLTQIFSGE